MLKNHMIIILISIIIFGCALKTSGIYKSEDVQVDQDVIDVTDRIDWPDWPDLPDRPDLPDVPDVPDTIEPDDVVDISDIDADEPEEVECTSHGQCDDDEPCNGAETCDFDSGVCQAGSPMPDGTECDADPRRICISGFCQESECGDGYTDDVEGEECDDGNDVEGDGCDNDCTYSCYENTECNDLHDCTDDICDTETTHTCSNPSLPDTTLCRLSAHDCDAEEYCDGSNPDCPEDLLSPPSTPCDDGDPCTDEDNCDETGNCVSEAFSPEGTPCYDRDPCTYPDECDGDGNCLGADNNELHDVVALSLGGLHTCALLDTGNMKCWGNNESGQLGDGTTTERHTPVNVSGLSLPAQSISCGYEHTCAILSDGTAKCWGKNEDGQLGNGSTANSATPVDIPGLTSTVSEVSAGFKHTCALLATGEVKCWGGNSSGQLGDGTTENRHTPIDVSDLILGVSQISCRGHHTCALLPSGGIKCWGYNGLGQLGDGTNVSKATPVDVSGLSSGVAAISVGYFHTCALLETGGIKCWGYNQNGELGLGTFTDSMIPMDVSALPHDISAISCNGFQTCALNISGNLKCWGRNDYGQLGDGTTTDRAWPTDVSGISHGLLKIAPGGYHTCALLDTSGLQCWGANYDGQLGNGEIGNSTTPVIVLCY